MARPRPDDALPCEDVGPGKSQIAESKDRPQEKLAEEKGFEPLDGCPSAVFKTAALDHSATPPGGGAIPEVEGDVPG